MIRIDIRLPGLQVSRPPSAEAVSVVVGGAARTLAAHHPGPELWTITAKRSRGRYDVKDAMGRRKSNVPAIGPGALHLKVSQVVVLEYYDRQREKPFIRCGTGLVNSVAPAPVIALGTWDQAWGGFDRRGWGRSWADYHQDPAPVFVYGTDLAGGAGYLGQPEGIVFARKRALLVHRMSGESGQPELLRVRVLEPGDTWAEVATIDYPLDLARDRELGSYYRDSSVFWDDSTRTLTYFARQEDRQDDFTAVNASAFTARFDESGNPTTNTRRDVTVSPLAVLRRAMQAPSVCGPWMARLNLLQDLIYGYRLGEVGWEDAWSRNWREAVAALLGGTLSDWHVQAGGVSNVGGSLTNFGYPARVGEDGVPRWLAVVSCTQLHAAPGGGLRTTSLREVAINAASGDLDLVAEVWRQQELLRSEVPRLSDTNDAWAASVLADNPSWEQSFTQDLITAGCTGDTGGPYHYTRLVERRWLGALYESVPVPAAYPHTGLRWYPFGSNVEIAALVADTPQGVPTAPAPLPARGPNLKSPSTRGHWTGGLDDGAYAGPNSRHVYVAETGDRYCAVLVPEPWFVPDPAGSWAEHEFDSYSPNGTVPGCWYLSELLTLRAAVPVVRYYCETRFCRIDAGGNVTLLAPLDRLTGLVTAAGPAVESLPCPENVYGWLPIPSAGICAWLMDARASAGADPIPRICVTDYDLSQVLYWISPADLGLPEDVFSADQVLGEETWAYAGESTHRYHNVDGTGPLLKGYAQPWPDGSGLADAILIVGLEWLTRVAPVEGTAGTTKSATLWIKASDSGFSVERRDESPERDWEWPNPQSAPEQGPAIVRQMAIGEDRIVYPRQDGGQNKLFQIK